MAKAGMTITHQNRRTISIHLIVRTNVDQDDHIFVGFWIRFEGEHDAAIIFDPAGPQTLQLSPQLVGLQQRIKRVLGQPFYRLQIRAAANVDPCALFA